jgi:hypothetical protein
MTGSWIPSGNDASRLGGQLRTAVAQLTAAAQTLQTLKNVMAQMTVGTDYTTVEAYFGLQAGTGGAVHDLVGSASDDLQGSLIQGLIQRLQ